jgi:UDP-3-O-[3-hydroxymyristoyl] glucosamine N-acyltransferase
VGEGVELGVAQTDGLGIGVGVGVGTGVGVGKGVVLGGAVGVKVGVGAGVGVAVGAGVGVSVGNGLTDRPQPHRRNPTRRRETATLRSRPIAKHPCKTRFKLQAVK